MPQKELKFIKIQSKTNGPAVWLISGQHGDEPNGPKIVRGVVKYLKNKLSKGIIYALPEANYSGIKTGKRKINGLDLNRSYPGEKSGKTAGKIAYHIFSKIIQSDADLVLDIHNDWIGSMFYIIIDPPNFCSKKIYSKIIETSLKTKIIAVKEKNDPKNIKYAGQALSSCCLKNGIPAFTMELGDAYKINKQNIQNGIKVILNILSDLKMVELKKYELNCFSPFKLRNLILQYVDEPRPTKNGRIKFFVKPGQIIHVKQKIAEIFNQRGKLSDTLIAKNSAIVLGIIDKKIIKKGEVVIALGEK